MALKFRRGTTAQKSGSLAFGEPYVNTTLGTLQIGLESGDATLTALGTGSNIEVAGISGSSLDITGNAKIDGNLTLGGQLTIGDASSDTVNVVASLSSSLIQSTTNVFDLGSADKIWRDLYISTGSIKFVAAGNVVSTLTPSVIESLQSNTGSYATTGSNSFNGAQYITGGLMVGNGTFHSPNPEALHVENTASINVAHFEGRHNNYTQINLKNTSSGSSASGDIVVTADNGTENIHFVDLGINSSTYDAGYVGYANDAYLLNVGKDLYVGTVGSEFNPANLHLFAQNNWETPQISISGSTQIGFNTLSVAPGFQYEFSGSIKADHSLEVVGSITSSLGYSGSIAGIGNVGNFSASVSNKLSSIEAVSSSLITTASNHEQRLDTIETISGTFARTNSTNTFTDTQTISGSMYISGDLIVQGSSSVQNISASAVSIGTNIINLNTSTPSVRFAGLRVIDSGSTAMSSSLLWDSQNNHWVYQRESGAVYGGGMLISGPRNLGALGDEVGMTSNRVVMGIGGDHISSSGMWTDGNNLSVPNNVEVSGSLIANGITSNLSGNATTATTLQNARLINGTSFDGSANITIQNLVSGSSQITLAGVTGYGALFTTFEEQANSAHTLVSGSSQINVASTTGDIALGSRTTGNYVASLVAGTNITLSNNTGEGATPTIGLTNNTISGIALGSNLATLTIGTGLSGTSYNGSGAVTIANTGVISNVAGTGVSVSGATGAVTISIGQSVGTSDNVRFGSIGVGMAASGTAGRIDAANDIVAFSSSDIRFKENIKPIENSLDKIRKISGNTYDWKEENKIEHGYEGNDVGVIAQEIEAVLPQLVQTRENGYKAVKYDKLVALLIEGIKEQQLQIEDLKIEIKDLKKQKGL